MADTGLQAPVPLSMSLLWRWQRAYYEGAGQRAWSDGVVPWRITSCPLTAQATADAIEAFARATAQPVTVLELGGGTGRLAFHLARELDARGVALRYVLSDVVEANVTAWRRHPQLAPLVARGLLDFAVHDACSPSPPRLLESGEALPTDGPLVVVASYLFDTLPHDAWRRREGRLQQTLVALQGPDTKDTPGPALADVRWTLTHRPPPPDAVSPFLRGYAARLADSDFLVPTGALACLAALERLTKGPLLTVFADKGAVTPPALWKEGRLPLARHGCVSASVNMHALRAWAGWRLWLQPEQEEADFGLYAIGRGLSPLVRRAVAQTWHACAARPPALSLLRTLDTVLSAPEAPDAVMCLHLLAASHFDPDVFIRLAEPLRARVGELPAAGAPVLVASLDAVWANAFEVGEASDVAFEVATVCHRAGLLADAARYYRSSLARRGRHATTLFNLALCALDTGDPTGGRALLEEVLQRTPTHARAAVLLSQL